MSASGSHLFDTAIGRCGIAWGPGGLRRLLLPGPNEASTRSRLDATFPAATPPEKVQGAIDDIVALLAGHRRDLLDVDLDMQGVPPFHARVYEVSRAILPGTTSTYGEVARRLGDPGAARAVGQALGKNPFAIIVPCHRVLAAGGKTGGFSASGGAKTKLRLLAIEAVHGDTPQTLSLFD